jgi:hypothetical protein
MPNGCGGVTLTFNTNNGPEENLDKRSRSTERVKCAKRRIQATEALGDGWMFFCEERKLLFLG